MCIRDRIRYDYCKNNILFAAFNRSCEKKLFAVDIKDINQGDTEFKEYIFNKEFSKKGICLLTGREFFVKDGILECEIMPFESLYIQF